MKEQNITRERIKSPRNTPVQTESRSLWGRVSTESIPGTEKSMWWSRGRRMLRLCGEIKCQVRVLCAVVGGNGKRRKLSLTRLDYVFPCRSFNRKFEFYFKCMKKLFKVFKLPFILHVKESCCMENGLGGRQV